MTQVVVKGDQGIFQKALTIWFSVLKLCDISSPFPLPLLEIIISATLCKSNYGQHYSLSIKFLAFSMENFGIG